MANSNDLPTDNNSVLEHPTLEDTIPDETVPDGTGSQNQLVSDAVTEHHPVPTTTPPRNWILYLPPEVRDIVFRYVLQLPCPVPYHLPFLRSIKGVQARTGIFHTSRLIHAESINVFYRVNTFYVSRLPRITVLPSQSVSDMIQNLNFDISLGIAFMRTCREQFIALVLTFGDPAIIRGTLRVLIYIPPPHHRRPSPLPFFLRGLRRFTNFRVVEINLRYTSRTTYTIAGHYGRVENALRTVLGPTTPPATGQGLTFLPQRFLNTQRPREDDWMNHLDGVRLDWNGDGTDAGENAVESEPPV